MRRSSSLAIEIFSLPRSSAWELGHQSRQKIAVDLFSVRRTDNTFLLIVVVIYSLFAWLITDIFPIDVSIASPLAGTDLLLCALFGGVISGIGSGLAIRYGGAMDGIEVMAVIFAKRAGVTVGTFVMVYNIILYIICGCVLQSWVLPLYSIVAYSAALKTVDFIVEGIDRARQSKVCNYCDRVAT